MFSATEILKQALLKLKKHLLKKMDEENYETMIPTIYMYMNIPIH